MIKVNKNNKKCELSFKIKEVVDIKDLIKLYTLRKKTQKEKDSIFSSRHDLRSFFKIFKKGKIWKIEINGEIAGYSRVSEDNDELKKGFSEIKNEKIIFLKGTFIVPKYRGLGLQKEFHKISKKYIKNKNYKKVCALVHPENKASINNVRKLGLKTYGIKMGNNGTMRLIMIKNN